MTTLDIFMTPPYLKLPDNLAVIDEEQVEMLSSVEEDTGDSLLKELVVTFIRDNEPRFELLAQSCANRNLETLRQHAHFLCGSTANLGILRVSQLCRQAEKAMIEGQFDAFESFPIQLQAEYQTGMSELKVRAGLN